MVTAIASGYLEYYDDNAFIVRIAICAVSSQSCTIGNSDDSELRERTEERFYLDVDNPATCNGTIINWTVCYYGRSDPGLFNSYWATYAVYRKMGSGGDEYYEKVSEMFAAVRTTNGIRDGFNQRGFNCYADFIDTGGSPLTVQVGDIIGACVFNPDEGFRRRLNIVGEMSGESLMQADISDDCTRDDIPSNIPRNSLQDRDNRRLHIYANIEPGK